MVDRQTGPDRLGHRFRRRLQQRRRQVEGMSARADEQLEQNFIQRLGKLVAVRRFVAAWLLLVMLLLGCVVAQIRALGGYYQSLQPAAGGLYNEGVIGSFTNASPLYATGQANDAVSKLIFASLFKHDDKNRLVGDLAESWQADPTGTSYTVRLRPNLQWHDNQPLTARDVAFTYHAIQNPDAQSPLNVSWQGVTIEAPDARTVVFKLPNPLSSFPYSLTNGIVPEHVLKNTPAAELRSARFNTQTPVGAGPFKLKHIEVKGDTPADREEEIALQPFSGYYAGAPKLSSFVVRTFPSETKLLAAFRARTVTAMVGLAKLPADLQSDDSVHQYNLPLMAATYAFFKTTAGPLADPAVRQALVGVADTGQIRRGLGYQTLPVNEPLLQNQAGYDARYQQTHTDTAAAAKLLDTAGWKPGDDGLRAKNGQPLMFRLYAQNTPEYSQVARTLSRQWRAIGVDAQVYLQSDTDLRSTVAYHSYDALLYGISLGVDADQFVYWNSTQADVRSSTRLNFSEYKSAAADAALEAGRTRSEPELRAIKYQAFLQAWQKDAPALGLYQPRFLYVTRGPVFNLTDHTLTTDTDRFNTVENWMIRQTQQPIKR